MAEFRNIPEDDIIDRIEGGDSIASIARELECNRSVLWRWLNADEQRSARSVRARQLAAFAWDERAEQGINDAADPFELARAKEMAHHYRWRASKIAPKQYGDKIETTHLGTIAIARDLTDNDLANIAAGAPKP